MKRGEVWTVSGTGYAGKPRPCLILQSDAFSETASVTVAAFTSDTTPAPLFRLTFPADTATGLRTPSALMVDKLTTVPKSRLGHRVGELEATAMRDVDRAVLVFLGIA